MLRTKLAILAPCLLAACAPVSRPAPAPAPSATTIAAPSSAPRIEATPEDAPPLVHACGVDPDGDDVDRALLEKPTTLKKGIGAVSQKVTTGSKDAQAYYDQGLAYLHSYVWI